MKKILMILVSVALLTGCTKQTVEPIAQGEVKTQQASKSASNNSDNTTYCYISTQTTSDTWTINVYQYLGSLSTVAAYYIQYDVNGVPSGWSLVSSFPHTLYSGFGASVTNIQIKETRCLTSPWGTICSDQFYPVPRCL